MAGLRRGGSGLSRAVGFPSGTLANETQQQIGQLLLTQLETLSEDLLDFIDMVALQHWLELKQ